MTDIYVAGISKESKVKRPVKFCCDIGVPKSVVGRKALNRILNVMTSQYYLPETASDSLKLYTSR